MQKTQVVILMIAIIGDELIRALTDIYFDYIRIIAIKKDIRLKLDSFYNKMLELPHKYRYKDELIYHYRAGYALMMFVLTL